MPAASAMSRTVVARRPRSANIVAASSKLVATAHRARRHRYTVVMDAGSIPRSLRPSGNWVIAGEEGDGRRDLPRFRRHGRRLRLPTTGQEIGGADLLEKLMPRDARRHMALIRTPNSTASVRCNESGHHTGLRGGIVGLRMLRPPTKDAGVVDNCAAVAGVPEIGQRGTGGSHHRCQRDVENAVPFVVGHVDDGAWPPRPALFTRTSSLPIRSVVEAISASTCAVEVTSQNHALDAAQSQFHQLIACFIPTGVRDGRRQPRPHLRVAPAGPSPTRFRSRPRRSRRRPSREQSVSSDLRGRDVQRRHWPFTFGVGRAPARR